MYLVYATFDCARLRDQVIHIPPLCPLLLSTSSPSHMDKKIGSGFKFIEFDNLDQNRDSTDINLPNSHS